MPGYTYLFSRAGTDYRSKLRTTFTQAQSLFRNSTWWDSWYVLRQSRRRWPFLVNSLSPGSSRSDPRHGHNWQRCKAFLSSSLRRPTAVLRNEVYIRALLQPDRFKEVRDCVKEQRFVPHFRVAGETWWPRLYAAATAARLGEQRSKSIELKMKGFSRALFTSLLKTGETMGGREELSDVCITNENQRSIAVPSSCVEMKNYVKTRNITVWL